MQANANYQLYYLETIQSVLKHNCTTPTTLTPPKYQTNIYAKNWILGNQTINDLINSYIQRSR